MKMGRPHIRERPFFFLSLAPNQKLNFTVPPHVCGSPG